MGTELLRRGMELPSPMWSALALVERPQWVSDVHKSYADAGAEIHTANTFRTDPHTLAKAKLAPGDWRELTTSAVLLAREAAGPDHRVFGSMSPLEDCYRPDLMPGLERCREVHGPFAQVLADAGCDGILCETFAQPEETLVAVEAGLKTGLPVWLALTLGPDGDLLQRSELRGLAKSAARMGVAALLINCSPVKTTLEMLPSIAGLGPRVGAYANLGVELPGGGWKWREGEDPAGYCAWAERWTEEGADIIGGCCGTLPEHIRALNDLFSCKESPD